MNVLIIEDDTIQSNLVTRFLKSKLSKWRFYEAIDGIEAMEFISVINMDLILIDMSLPRMNGIECLKSLKDKENLPPFIAMSGGLTESLVGQLYSLGAQDCIRKPFYLEELLQKVVRVS